mgnify:FL=1
MMIFSIVKKIFFPFYKSKNIKIIFNILNSSGENKNAMFVGGCVRKFILDQEIKDIDIATILNPEEVIKKFENTDVEVKKTGIEHGTLTLLLNKQHFEITTLRKDISTDGRHAVVSFTDNWKEDSARRDFTINSIYLDNKGKIFDPHSGISDLKEGKIIFIGDPNQRIKEDYLRVLRYIRFSVQYENYNITEDVFKALQLNLGGVFKLSKERVYQELNKIMSLKNFSTILNNDKILKIFRLVFPEFRYVENLKRIGEINSLKYLYINRDIILASMLIDSSNNHSYFSYKYKVSNETKNNLTFFAQYLKEIKKNKNFFKKDLKKNIFYHGKNKIKLLFILNFIYNKKIKVEDLKIFISKIEKISIPSFPINGTYLIDKGIKKGKNVGKIIKKIEKQWIENDFNLNSEKIDNLLKKNSN